MEEKTSYLKNLETLMQSYSSCYGNCTGDPIVNRLSLLFTMFENAEIFEKKATSLEHDFPLDIDRDVDYAQWGKPETWRTKKTKGTPSASPLTYKALEIDKGSLANRMSDMLPSPPETVQSREHKKENHEMTYSERDKFKTTVNTLMNVRVFNSETLDYAIDKAMQKLCTALQQINRSIEGKHTNPIYEKLYTGTLYAANLLPLASEVKQSHKDWRSKYLVDEISESSLLQHAHDAIVALFKAGVLDGIEANTTNEQKAEYKNEINFDDDDFPKKIKPQKLYIPFRDIYRYNGSKYTADKVKAGRLLFKIRKDKDKLDDFLRFEITLNLIYKDLDDLRNKENNVESVMGDIDFATLECRFSEDEVNSAGIRHAQAPAVLALMEKMVDKETTNMSWLCFYCVLLEKEWIGKNVSEFCKNMNGLFDLKLDNSAFSKELKIYGKKIEQWDEQDCRRKKRKAFGLKFKKLLEAMLEYKMGV